MEAGVAAIEVSSLDPQLRGVRPGRNEGYLAPLGKLMKEELGVPVLLTGGHRSAEHMQKLLDEGACDLFTMARPLIREPGLPARWASGNMEPSDCISCNKCGEQPGHCCFLGTRM